MRAKQQARAFVAGDPDQQLGVIGIGDIRREHRVVGGFLAQLVRFAGQQPDQRVEPEQGGGDAGQQQLDPVHAGDVGELVGDDRLGFARRFDRAGVEQDDRAHQAPADRRGELVAGEQGGAVLEPHAPLGAGEGAQPMAVDQHVGAGAQGDQPGQREEGDEQQDRRGNGVERRSSPRSC